MVLEYQLTQHSRGILLIKSLVDYLGCGNVYYYPDKSNGVYFKVRAKEDLKTKILLYIFFFLLKG